MSVSVDMNGSLWINNGSSVTRIGTQDAPTSYAKDIASFARASCIACHFAPLGTAPMSLESRELWVENIDKIILRLEAETMPPEGNPLTGGSVELVRRWRDEGFRP